MRAHPPLPNQKPHHRKLVNPMIRTPAAGTAIKPLTVMCRMIETLKPAKKSDATHPARADRERNIKNAMADKALINYSAFAILNETIFR